MNLVETYDLLTFVAAFDNRKFGDETAVAWQGLLGDLEIEECREAVRRHFRKSTNYLMPAHVRELVMVQREERRPRHEVVSMPSRFEDDDERVQRVKAGISMCARVLSIAAERRPRAITAEPANLSPSDIIHQRALERARRERRQSA
jgi:hypothetical protein